MPIRSAIHPWLHSSCCCISAFSIVVNDKIMINKNQTKSVVRTCFATHGPQSCFKRKKKDVLFLYERDYHGSPTPPPSSTATSPSPCLFPHVFFMHGKPSQAGFCLLLHKKNPLPPPPEVTQNIRPHFSPLIKLGLLPSLSPRHRHAPHQITVVITLLLPQLKYTWLGGRGGTGK